LVGRPAEAASKYWQVANGDWHVGSNWNGGVPGSSDYAYITNGGTVDIETATGDVTVAWIRAGFAGGNQSGAVVQNDNTVNVPDRYWLGNGDDVGTHTLNGGTLNVGTFYISEGTALSGVTQTNGTANVSNLYLGSNQTGSQAFYDLQNGDLNVTNAFRIANQAGANIDAVFTQSGGTVDSNVTLQLGSKAGTTGSAIYNLDGGLLTISNATPFQFSSNSAPIYFDFDGGIANLLGTWNFTSLTAIANSDFRFHGAVLQDGDLTFAPGTGALDGYTVISSLVIPEPSTFLIWSLGLIGLVAYARRRRTK
jgi:hypothetical protein